MRKYKYDEKEYDFDSFKLNAINNFDSWAKLYNLGDTRTSKVREAMLDMLQHMTDDLLSHASLSKINFDSGYANGKGLFGKKVKDSKHYRNAVAYLLSQFNQMDPYTEPKPQETPKTQLSRAILGRDILNYLGDTSKLSDLYKNTAQIDAFNRVLAKYNWDNPDLYDIEEGYTAQDFKNLLSQAVTAFGTDSKEDDDYYYSKFGLTSPFYKAPEPIRNDNDPLSPTIEQILRIYPQADPDKLREILGTQYLSNLGIDTSQIRVEAPAPALINQNSDLTDSNPNLANQAGGTRIVQPTSRLSYQLYTYNNGYTVPSRNTDLSNLLLAAVTTLTGNISNFGSITSNNSTKVADIAGGILDYVYTQAETNNNLQPLQMVRNQLFIKKNQNTGSTVYLLRNSLSAEGGIAYLPRQKKFIYLTAEDYNKLIRSSRKGGTLKLLRNYETR